MAMQNIGRLIRAHDRTDQGSIQHCIKSIEYEAESASGEERGLCFCVLARFAYLHALRVLEKHTDRSHLTTFKSYLRQALGASEKGAEARSLQCLIFHCCLASAVGHPGWQEKMKKCMAAQEWIDPGLELLSIREYRSFMLPCDLVEGTTKEQRCKRKLSDALRVMKLHIELNKVQMKDEMAGMLLSELVNSNSLIRPADWQSKAMAVCQNYFQDRLVHPKKLKEEQEEAAQVAKGAKLRQESQRGKLGGKKLQQKASASMLDKVLSLVDEMLKERGKAVVSRLLTVPVDELEKRLEEPDKDGELTGRDALKFWVENEGMPYGILDVRNGALAHPVTYSDHLRGLVLRNRKDSFLQRQLRDHSGEDGPTDDAIAERSKQVLNGDGFVYIGDLPTELLEEPSTSGQASTSGQQSSIPMLPVNGRDALMHDASADLSEALTKAYKAGVLSAHIPALQDVRSRWETSRRLKQHLDRVRQELATAEFQAAVDSDTAPDIRFQDVGMQTRVMLTDRGREISEEGETRLKCRGWQLLELIQCYGRLSLLQCTSAQFEPGDEMLVLAMEGALSNLAEERSESSWKRVLMRLQSRWEDTNRFACHFLGPDADEPVASSLALIKDPDLCRVKEDQSAKQQFLDVILDGLWILQRNKLLTSGFVYQIALYLLLNRKDDECVSVHSLCWEHLGSLSDGAVEMLADTVCMQLGLCQHLLKDYANARSMLHKVSALELDDPNVVINHLRCQPETLGREMAYANSLLGSISRRSPPVDHIKGYPDEQEQGELMKDFVGALYPDSKTKIPPMPSFQQEELDREDILALLRRCMGCIDQAILCRFHADEMLLHHRTYLQVIVDLLNRISEGLENNDTPQKFWNSVGMAVQACEKTSEEFHKAMKAVAEREQVLLAFRKKSALRCCPEEDIFDLAEFQGLLGPETKFVHVQPGDQGAGAAKRLGSPLLEALQEQFSAYALPKFGVLVKEFFIAIRSPQREEALPRSLGNIVNAILVDLLTMEMNGMQLVDVQMAGARLAALETLRIIERRNEACVLNHVGFAALHCLRDKFDGLVAQWEGEKEAAEKKALEMAEAESTKMQEELLREVEEEGRRKAAQEEKKRKKSKGAAKNNAKLEEERAAREKAEQEEAAQREAEEEREREQQRQEEEELRRKEEAWQQMQNEIAESEAGSQGQPDAVKAVAARADDEKPVERASQAVRYEALHLPPGRPSSGRRSGRDRRGSEATRSGRAPPGEGPPEPNGHARTATPADSNGGSAVVPYYDKLRSGNPPGLSRGATEGAEGAPPDSAASLGDGDNGDASGASHQAPSAQHGMRDKYRSRATGDPSHCLHCGHPEHSMASCPILEGMEASERAAVTRGYKVDSRRGHEREAREQEGGRGSRKSSGKPGKGKGAAVGHCLHCGAEDHKCMRCPALADLDLDARAGINQAYLETPNRVQTLLAKHLGPRWVELTGGPAAATEEATPIPAEPEVDCFCKLCQKTGHREEGCPVTLGIPAHKLQTVLELVHSRKRHYALNVIVHYWGRTTPRSHPIPKDAVLVKDVRFIKRFCCHCDADNHKLFDCPELEGMDAATLKALEHAYADTVYKGQTPEQVYHKWLQGSCDRQAITCALCAEEHSVEECPQLASLPIGPFSSIMDACKAGNVPAAVDLLHSWREEAAGAEAAAAEAAKQQQQPRPVLQIAAAPAPVEPQDSQAAQSWPRAASTTQASAPAVQPLKPGFWKAMKLPAKDSPLGGIKVRADMVSDAFQACLHCLNKKHSFNECPELERLPKALPDGKSTFGQLQRAYKDGDLRHARKIVEMAMGCRMCRRTGHWLPKCPRVPSHISWELEEIYKKGPVEAAVKLVKNALEVQKPAAAQKPAASQLPTSAAGPTDRLPAKAAPAAPAPANWAAALKKGASQEQQQKPASAQAVPAPMPSRPATWPGAASAGGQPRPPLSEQPEEEQVAEAAAQDVKASEGVWKLLADDSSQSDTADSVQSGLGLGGSSRPQPQGLATTLGGPFFPPQSPQRLFPSAPTRMDTAASNAIPPELLPGSMQSLSDTLPAPAAPLAAPWRASAPEAHAAGNPVGYNPFVMRMPPPGLFPAAPAAPPSAAARRLPPGFLYPLDEAAARKQADVEAAMRVFSVSNDGTKASSGPPGFPPQPLGAQSPPGIPLPHAWSPHGAQQRPTGGVASAPPQLQQPPQPQEPDSHEFLLGLLGVGEPKPAQQQQQQQQPRVMSQPAPGIFHVASQRKAEPEGEYDERESPPRSQQHVHWQNAGVEPALQMQKGAWRKPLGPAVFEYSAPPSAASSPARPQPSPSRIGPHAWPPTSPAGLKASAAERAPYLAVHTEEQMSESEEEETEERDEEDEEGLKAAIQASLQDSKERLGPLHDAVRAVEAGQPRLALMGVATPGLQNQTGEYNCFLNVIVQCLWHCRSFRSGLLSRLDPQQLQEVPVVWELLGLFIAFAKEEDQRRTVPGAARTEAVAPNALREALHDLDSRLFSIGEMSDAAEVLNAVYDSLGAVPGGAELVDSVFGLRVREVVHCGSCGRDTHEAAYTQSFYNVSTTALRFQALSLEPGEASPTLGEALRGVERQTLKSCDTDEGGCGRDQAVLAFLEGTPPAAFTLQLAWESHAESSADIRATMATIQETLDLGEVYLGLPKGQHLYRLSSMVCYYGAHYHAFVHAGNQWIMFDDATTSAVGAWDSVMHKCQLGKIQPSVLFFEAPSS